MFVTTAVLLRPAQWDILGFSIFQNFLQCLGVVVQGGEQDSLLQDLLCILLLQVASISCISRRLRTENGEDSLYEVILPVIHRQVEQLALHLL